MSRLWRDLNTPCRNVIKTGTRCGLIDAHVCLTMKNRPHVCVCGICRGRR
jgi:hypothetical protein